MEAATDGEPFSDEIVDLKPGYDLRPGELAELRAVEEIVRDVWQRFAPPKPAPADLSNRRVETENEAVDKYLAEKARLHGVLARLMYTDDWQLFFPASEHGRLEAARRIVASHGGDREVEE